MLKVVVEGFRLIRYFVVLFHDGADFLLGSFELSEHFVDKLMNKDLLF